VYPVKSCAGVRVERAEVTRSGFADDRRWMITDAAGTFLTQRELPELSQLRLSLPKDNDAYRIARGDDELHFPRRLVAQKAPHPVRVRVWSDAVDAIEHEPLSAWLSGALGRTLRGVYLPDDSLRPVNPKRARPDDRVGFADGYPFLLVSEESIAELNRRLAARGESPLDVRRFRPNVLVAGCAAPHAEDEWRDVRIGQVAFRNAKLCDRCSVTTVDPESGRRGKEPLRTLSEYRRWDGKVWFAVNLLHAPAGIGAFLSLGDEVEPVSSEPGA
jgi:uncharacterized protein YcbX